MNKRRLVKGVAILMLLLLAMMGCQDNSLEGEATLHLSLERASRFNTRNIVPEGTDPLTIVSYKIGGIGPSGAQFEEEIEEEEITISGLKVGYWTFTAIGYNAQKVPIATGETTLYLSATSTSASITLNQEVGSGSIDLTYQWNAQQTNAESILNFKLLDIDNKEVAGITPAINIEDGEANFSGTVASGFYTVIVNIESGGEIVGGLVESLRVIDQTVSKVTHFLEIGKLIDAGFITIIDGSIPPFDGEVSLSSTSYAAGDALTLTLTAGQELSAYTFQWYCEGVLIESETSHILLIEAVQGGSERYDVVISHPTHGAIGSCGVLVKVPVTPTIVT
ncbi:MAG TPA: hypothetical protein GXZ38_00790 [Spirochaetales bacterium]|nr:hypothetical protein [Spirochaetales bacterium]